MRGGGLNEGWRRPTLLQILILVGECDNSCLKMPRGALLRVTIEPVTTIRWGGDIQIAWVAMLLREALCLLLDSHLFQASTVCE